LVHAQDIVKAMSADVKLPDITAIPCEFIGNYEMAAPAWRSWAARHRGIARKALGEQPGRPVAGDAGWWHSMC